MTVRLPILSITKARQLGGDRMKYSYIRFRCSEILKEQIEKKAEAEGKTMTEYITDLIKADLRKTTKKKQNLI